MISVDGQSRGNQRHIEQVNTSVNDTNMSADHNLPPGAGGQGAAARFNAQFGQMNINAQPFVPNVQAQPFMPMGGGMRGYPYSGYPMHGE